MNGKEVINLITPNRQALLVASEDLETVGGLVRLEISSQRSSRLLAGVLEKGLAQRKLKMEAHKEGFCEGAFRLVLKLLEPLEFDIEVISANPGIEICGKDNILLRCDINAVSVSMACLTYKLRASKAYCFGDEHGSHSESFLVKSMRFSSGFCPGKAIFVPNCFFDEGAGNLRCPP